MPAMTPKQFWLTAASWGSAMTSGDPGACMYGFSENGLVQSEQHRKDCIQWIETECRKAAIVNAAAGENLAEQNAELDAMLAYLKTAPVEGTMPQLDEFTTAYVEAAHEFGPEYLSKETLDQFISDCSRFQEFYNHLFEGSERQAGHDFWQTRCGHGSGFLDGDWEKDVGEILTKASKSFGKVDLYVDDDGFIYGMGGNKNPDSILEASQVTKMRPPK